MAQCESLLVVLSVRRERRRVALRLHCERAVKHADFHRSGPQEWTDGDRVVEVKDRK